MRDLSEMIIDGSSLRNSVNSRYTLKKIIKVSKNVKLFRLKQHMGNKYFVYAYLPTNWLFLA